LQAVTSTAVTDEALMVRVQADNGLAFTELYVRHVDHALSIASEFCADVDGAEEVVQESFLSIWRSRAEYRPQLGTFEAWSMRIVHNRAVDSVRLVRIRPPLQPRDLDDESDEEDAHDSTFDHAVAGSEHARLFDALRLLPMRQTEVILLAYYGDLSLSEIAARLGIPPGTAKGRMRLGLEKLRDQWLARERRHLAE
jgi:RNA polymerase sigma-70 factor (ECF subfamily)